MKWLVVIGVLFVALQGAAQTIRGEWYVPDQTIHFGLDSIQLHQESNSAAKRDTVYKYTFYGNGEITHSLYKPQHPILRGVYITTTRWRVDNEQNTLVLSYSSSSKQEYFITKTIEGIKLILRDQ